MATTHLGLLDTGEAFDNNTRYTAVQIIRNHRLMDSMMVGALRCMSPGVLFSEYGATSFQVTAGAGLTVNIAAGTAVIKHTTLGAAYAKWESTYNLTGLTASATNYIFATIENSGTNKTQESMVPLFTTQTSSVAPDGAILLATVVTSGVGITSILDQRRVIRPLNIIIGGYVAGHTYQTNDVVKDGTTWWIAIADSTSVAPAEGASWTKFAIVPTVVGDMLKSTYDTDNDGKVDIAELAEAAPWSGITGKPSTFPPDTHNHDDRYYTETESDALFSPVGHTHTASQITDFDAAAQNAVENIWGAPVADLTALRAVAPADRQDRQQRFVEGVGTHGANYAFDSAGTGTDDGDLIIEPTTGTGRWFKNGNSGGGGVTDHGGLTGLGDDDHSIYLLLAGRAGGQIVYGGTASGNNYEIHSTSHGTKGLIKLGGITIDEVNTRLGIGTTTPTFEVEAINESTNSVIAATAYGTGSGRLIGRQAGGTKALPTQTLNGTIIAIFGGRGYGATGFAASSSARLKVVAAEDFTDAAMGAEMVFDVIPIGSTTPATAGKVTSAGQFMWGGSTANAAALVQFDSTTHGFLPMRMTTTQMNAIGSPPNGLVIHNSTTDTLWQRQAGAWVELISATAVQTLTNKRLDKRVQSVADAATITPNADTNDMVDITAIAQAFTIANPSGTPTNGQLLLIQIKDNGTARAIAFGTAYVRAGNALPTTTTASKILTLLFIYTTANTLNKWRLLSVDLEA